MTAKFGMKWKMWPKFESEINVALQQNNRMLFEILVLSTTYTYHFMNIKMPLEGSLNRYRRFYGMKEKDEALFFNPPMNVNGLMVNNIKKTPKFCRQYYEKWDKTKLFFDELRQDLGRTEDRLMLDVYGIEGTGKSIYGGLRICHELDPNFGVHRIRNRNREIIQLISDVQNEGVHGVKMLMRDEASGEHGIDSWVAPDEIQHEMEKLREDQVGYVNVSVSPTFDMNYHFNIRMIDNTFFMEERPTEDITETEKRVEWMLKYPHKARAIISCMSAKDGVGWKRPYPFGFIELMVPGLERTGENKYRVDRKGKELLIEYLKFKREQNMLASTGDNSGKDYRKMLSLITWYIFSDENDAVHRIKFYFDTRKEKRDGEPVTIIKDVHKGNVKTLIKNTLKQHDAMWRTMGENTLEDMASTWSAYCFETLKITNREIAIEELLLDREKLCEIHETYQKMIGDTGIEKPGEGGD